MQSCLQDVVLALSEISIQGDENSEWMEFQGRMDFSVILMSFAMLTLIPTTDDQKTILDDPAASTW
jgi:hypothetical protein